MDTLLQHDIVGGRVFSIEDIIGEYLQETLPAECTQKVFYTEQWNVSSFDEIFSKEDLCEGQEHKGATGVVSTCSIEDFLAEDELEDTTEEMEEPWHYTNEEVVELMQKHKGLLMQCVNSFHADPLLREELLLVARMGLYKGLTKFDRNKGLKDSTYLKPAIINNVLAYLSKLDRDAMGHLNVFIDESLSSENEILAMTDKDAYKNNEFEISAEDEYLNKSRCRKIHELLELLTTKEKFVIVHTFGINDELVMTQKQLAQKLQIQQPTVSLVKNTALKKLRKFIMRLIELENW